MEQTLRSLFTSTDGLSPAALSGLAVLLGGVGLYGLQTAALRHAKNRPILAIDPEADKDLQQLRSALEHNTSDLIKTSAMSPETAGHILLGTGIASLVGLGITPTVLSYMKAHKGSYDKNHIKGEQARLLNVYAEALRNNIVEASSVTDQDLKDAEASLTKESADITIPAAIGAGLLTVPFAAFAVRKGMDDAHSKDPARLKLKGLRKSVDTAIQQSAVPVSASLDTFSEEDLLMLEQARLLASMRSKKPAKQLEASTELPALPEAASVSAAPNSEELQQLLASI
jgi:hypothetical protein